MFYHRCEFQILKGNTGDLYFKLLGWSLFFSFLFFISLFTNEQKSTSVVASRFTFGSSHVLWAHTLNTYFEYLLSTDTLSTHHFQHTYLTHIMHSLAYLARVFDQGVKVSVDGSYISGSCSFQDAGVNFTVYFSHCICFSRPTPVHTIMCGVLSFLAHTCLVDPIDQHTLWKRTSLKLVLQESLIRQALSTRIESNII